MVLSLIFSHQNSMSNFLGTVSHQNSMVLSQVVSHQNSMINYLRTVSHQSSMVLPQVVSHQNSMSNCRRAVSHQKSMVLSQGCQSLELRVTVSESSCRHDSDGHWFPSGVMNCTLGTMREELFLRMELFLLIELFLLMELRFLREFWCDSSLFWRV